MVYVNCDKKYKVMWSSLREKLNSMNNMFVLNMMGVIEGNSDDFGITVDTNWILDNYEIKAHVLRYARIQGALEAVRKKGIYIYELSDVREWARLSGYKQKEKGTIDL
jgi:hypothetical protein